jgi:hypothetical protein
VHGYHIEKAKVILELIQQREREGGNATPLSTALSANPVAYAEYVDYSFDMIMGRYHPSPSSNNTFMCHKKRIAMPALSCTWPMSVLLVI